MKSYEYLDKINYIEGIIVQVHDGSVAIDLKGRLGHLKVPKRMVITDYELRVGQEVGLNMSYIEVLDDVEDARNVAPESNLSENKS